MLKIKSHQIAAKNINATTGAEENPAPGSVMTVATDGSTSFVMPPTDQMRYRGAWVQTPTEAYGIGHVVSHNGGIWMASLKSPVGEPVAGNTNWRLIEGTVSEGPGIVLIEAGATAPPTGTPTGTVVARKAVVA